MIRDLELSTCDSAFEIRLRLEDHVEGLRFYEREDRYKQPCQLYFWDPSPHIMSHRIPETYPPPGSSTIADKIRARRGPKGLLELDGTLLHAPILAEGWDTFMGAIRQKTNLPGDVRELMVRP